MLVLAGEDGAEVLDILLPHPLVEVEPVRFERRDRREGCGGRDTVRKQRGGREGVRPTPGDPPGAESTDAERVADRSDVRGAVGNRSSLVTRRAAVAGPVV